MTITVVLFLRVALGTDLARFTLAVRLASLSALAQSALAATLFAIPANEALAHDDTSATLHARTYTYPLHDAARAGDLDSVNHFLAAPHTVAVNIRDRNGAAPLHLAAWRGHVSVVAALIAAAAEVDAKNNLGQTALMYAAQGGHAPVVSVLIALGANVNVKGYYRRAPLHWGVLSGNAAVVSVLIAAGANVNAKNNAGETPLHFPVGQGNVSVVSVLIESGGHYGDACANGFVVNPAASSPPCICPADMMTGGECDIVAVCASPSVLNPMTNGCDCPATNIGADGADAPGECAAPSAQVCAGLNPPAFFNTALVSITAGECVPFANCQRAATLDGKTNTCECAPPSALDGTGLGCECLAPNLNFGGGDCRAPSAANCAEHYDPPKFYDQAAGECGDTLFPCHDSAKRKADNSGCECPAGTFAHGDPSGGYRRISKYGGRHKNGRYEYIPDTAECHANHVPIPHSLNGLLSAVRANNPTLVAHFIFGHGQNPDGGSDALHWAAQGGHGIGGKNADSRAGRTLTGTTSGGDHAPASRDAVMSGRN